MSELFVDHISFSQLQQVEECPYAHFLLKLANVEPVPNAFAQAGSLCHELLAGWAQGKIAINELPVKWIERFPKEVTASFPNFLASKGYAEKLFDAVLTYLEEFNGFPGYEILGSEKAFTSMISGERFVGIIDLILKDKGTGEITIVDYKSCSLSSFKKSRDQMYRQLLLYSKYCTDQYGCPPAKLRFELVKDNTFDERMYTSEDFISARLWAESVVQEMKSKDVTDWFVVNPNFFRCTSLCSARTECPCGKPEYFRKEDSSERKRSHAVA